MHRYAVREELKKRLGIVRWAQEWWFTRVYRGMDSQSKRQLVSGWLLKESLLEEIPLRRVYDRLVHHAISGNVDRIRTHARLFKDHVDYSLRGCGI